MDINKGFTTRPDYIYEAGEIATDALALTWDNSCVFAALCTSLMKKGVVLIESSKPVTCEITGDGVSYCLAEESEVALGVAAKPSAVTVNGSALKKFRYDAVRKAVVIKLPAGEGNVKITR